MKILLYCYCLLLVACAGTKIDKTESQTILAGKIVNRTENSSRVVLVNSPNPFDPERLVSVIDDDGYFEIHFTQPFGVNATFVYGGEFVNFYSAQGDSLFVTIDDSLMRSGRILEAVIFSGDQAKENSQLHPALYDLYPMQFMDVREYAVYDKGPETFLEMFAKAEMRILDTLDRRHHLQSFTPFVRVFLEREIRYTLSNYLIADYADGEETPAVLTDKLKVLSNPLFGLYDAENFKTSMFSYHLNSYMQTLLRTLPDIQKLQKDGDWNGYLRESLRMLTAEPASSARDYMVYKLIERVPDPQAILDTIQLSRYVSESAAEMIVSALWGRDTRFQVLPLQNLGYMTSEGDVAVIPSVPDMLAFLRGRYPDKVVYIDVWATWCGSCLYELPFAKELQAKLAGKEVVFVNLCLSSSRETWERMVRERGIDGENYYFDTDATALFISSFPFHGYPTYMLLDKDGILATNRALRPSRANETVIEIGNLL